jgi:antitoxin MazE
MVDMKVQVQKWGNSLALRIPKSFAVETNIEEGSTVEMTMGKNGIFVRSPKQELTLDSLLAEITSDNLHGEIDLGEPEGDEVW